MKEYKEKAPLEALRLEDSGAAISHYRSAKGLTQSEFGALLGVGKSQVCKIESGRNTSVKTLVASYGALGLSPGIIVEPDLSPEERVFLAYDIVDQIALYAKRNNLSEQEAYRRLDREGRVDRFILNYDIFKDNVI